MALAAGVNLIDTADIYSSGKSEEIVGEAVKGRRDDLLLATKQRFPMGDGPNDEGASRHHIIRAAEASLRRLGTDYIDLYQVHQWDGQTPLEETLAALTHLVDSGKVRYAGISNFSAWHLMKAMGIADRHGFTPIVSQQIHYSLQAREAEYELVPLALDAGARHPGLVPARGRPAIGQVPSRRRSPGRIAALSATGTSLRSTTRRSSTTSSRSWSRSPTARGVSAAQVALAWTLGRPGISTVIVGARTSEQLADNLAAADLVLTGDEAAPAGAGQPARPALSLLAPGDDPGEEPPERRRPVAAGAPPVALYVAP